MMKRNLLSTIVIPLLLLSCSEEVAVKGLRLSSTELQLQENHDTLLIATVDPEKLSSGVSWRSMDESVATVDAEGRVKGVLGGRTFVLASVGALTKGCAVTVFARVENITFSDNSIFMGVGESREIKVGFTPERALNHKLVWTSSNPEVALVSGGIIIGKGIGTATITAVSDDNPEISAVCEVEVGVPVEAVEISTEDTSIFVGESLQLMASAVPSDASHPEIIWTSADEAIATVGETGLVTGVSAGKVTITATAPFGGASASCSLEVRTHVTGVTLDKHTVDIYSLETVKLSAAIQPESAFVKDVTWTSSNPLVATVDTDGNVTGRSKGSTVITVTTKDGGFTDNCTVNVISGTAAVSEIKFEKEVYTLTVGKTMEIIPIVLPLDAGDKTVQWSVSDNTVASVSAEGIITGLKAGSVTLKAISVNNPAASATCTLKVVPFSGGPGGGYDDDNYKWEG